MKVSVKKRNAFLRVCGSLLVVVLICAAFASCGKTTTKPESPSTDQTQATEADADQTQTAAPSTTAAQTQALPESTDGSIETTGNEEGIRAEVKDSLDSYEVFVDDYCAFMKKYAAAGDKTELLADYSDFMSKYAETAEKIDNLKKDLSDSELAYYTEVTTRCAEKLNEVNELLAQQ